MAYRAYRSDRRYRRRRRLLIIVSFVAVISMIAFLVSRETEQRGAVEFFAGADESSDLHAQASAELESALSSIGLIPRQDLVRRLQSVVDAAAEADALLTLEAPSFIGSSYGTMTTSSTSWNAGAAEIAATIKAIMDGELVEGAQQQLEAALDLIRVGDVSYGLFLGTLSSLPPDLDIPVFTVVAYINPDAQNPLLYDSLSLVLRIQGSYDLSPRHDIAIVGTTFPAPIGESDSLPAVPFSSSLDIQAVITNQGNEDESLLEVTLEMLNVDTGQTLTISQVIADLEAGASTTLLFENVDIDAGGLYQAKLTATIADDIDPTNNQWDMTFVWRDES